jgi:hypothetical protein
MVSIGVRVLRASMALGLMFVVVSSSAAAQTPPPTPPAAPPGKVTTMPDERLKKLDAYLKRAVEDQRPDLLKVMVRLAKHDGAEVRVRELLTKMALKVDRTISDGQILLTTLEAKDLLDLADSDDVAGVSFDSVVKAQKKRL